MLFFTACDPFTLTLGGAAVVGTEATRNQNGVTGALSDSDIQAKINAKLLKEDSDIFDRVELSVKHGTVVVIGYMKNEEQCRRAMQLIRSICGSKTIVFDETKIGNIPAAKDFAIDSSITSRVKTSLAFDGNVQSLNYDVTTVKGIVYICGTAQSRYERDVVLNCARTTSGVEKVVSYISINKHVKISKEHNDISNK